jgi:hypothetical protein
VSGSTRSAKATVSEWNASTTTRNGILYSPRSSFARNMSCTPCGFIDEFHAMLAMKRISVSIAYGSAATALAMTMCISPCAASGDSHEYALSIRSGRPSASIASVSGRVGKPSGGCVRGVSGASMIAA